MLPPELKNLVEEFATNAGHPFKKTLAVLRFVNAHRDTYALQNAYVDTFDELSPWLKFVTITNLEVVHREGLTLHFNPMRWYFTHP